MRYPPLNLEYIDGRNWRLLTSFWFRSEAAGYVYVEPGFVTDFNSVPRLFWRLIPPSEFAQAGVIHDYLYRNNGVTRLQADRAHMEVLRLLGAPAWKYLLMYAGIRVGGWVPWNKYRQADGKLAR